MIRSARIVTKSLTRTLARPMSTIPILPIQDLKFTTLNELHAEATKAYSTNPMFGTKVGKEYQWMSYAEFDIEVGKCRILLNQHKVSKGDKVALISNNRAEWAVTKYATVSVGGQIVPMYVFLRSFLSHPF